MYIPLGFNVSERGFSFLAACRVFRYVLVNGRFSGLFSLLSWLDTLQILEFSFESTSLVVPFIKKVALFLFRDSENFDFSTPFFVSEIELTGIFSTPMN